MLICKINDLLEQEGRKKIWLAKQIGVTKQQVHNWGSNRSLPSVKYVYDMIRVTNWNFEEMFEEINIKINIPEGDFTQEELDEFLDEFFYVFFLHLRYSDLEIRSDKDEDNFKEAYEFLEQYYCTSIEPDHLVDVVLGNITKEEFIEQLEEIQLGKTVE